MPVRYRSFIHDSARWDGFAFRPDDIVISTPAKCGTTWMQMICALLIHQDPELPAPLAELSPWFEQQLRSVDDVTAALGAQTHRRFIKSHTPLDGLPQVPGVTYVSVGRDPRDVALSWDGHVANVDPERIVALRAAAVGLEDLTEEELQPPAPPSEDPRERFWTWVDDLTPPTDNVSSLRGLLHHVAGFWQRRDRPECVLLHYADLQADLEGEMRRLAARLGVDVVEERWPALVEAARFQRMRARAELVAPNPSLWRDTTSFFKRGTSGQWREMLTDDDLARYERIAAGLASSDLLAWLHRP